MEVTGGGRAGGWVDSLAEGGFRQGASPLGSPPPQCLGVHGRPGLGCPSRCPAAGLQVGPPHLPQPLPCSRSPGRTPHLLPHPLPCSRSPGMAPPPAPATPLWPLSGEGPPLAPASLHLCCLSLPHLLPVLVDSPCCHRAHASPFSHFSLPGEDPLSGPSQSSPAALPQPGGF